MQSAELDRILRELTSRDVKFVIVGMLSAVLQGAPVTTFDLDIVPLRTEENIRRLVEALTALNARYRADPKNLWPTAELLILPEHALLETDAGNLDVLGELHDGETFQTLAPDCVELELGQGSVLVLSLEQLIAIKRRANRPKDQAALPMLQAALEELQRQS